ncbi:MAG: GntR family transcriptional regulator [Pilosibacter sp.]
MPFEIFSERKNGETNSKYAYRLLRESIMSFKLLPGEALDETVISEQFGTSRTPVS